MAPKPLHICSVNTQGLLQSEKRKRLFEWCKQQKCQILMMQETHFTRSMNDNLNNDLPGEIFHSWGSSASRGVAIWFTKQTKYNIINEFKDQEGRYLLINVELGDNVYFLINIYAPNIAK